MDSRLRWRCSAGLNIKFRSYSTPVVRLADDHARLFRGVGLGGADQLAHLPRHVTLAKGQVTPARGQGSDFRPAEVQARRLAETRHLQRDGGDGLRHARTARRLDDETLP